jgi:hypothetical protein
MILVAFVCFALLLLAWLVAPGLDRPASSAGAIDATTDSLAAGAPI